jgi:hypothetical protein
MEIKSEYHETQKTLFRRVNQIRKGKGTCDFEQEGTGYRLKYCEDEDLDNTYIVQNGTDGAAFRLHDAMEGSFFHLNKGEALVYEYEDGDKVWFSYPKWREGLDETEMELDQDVGYTEYGSLSEMVQAGLILNARHADRLLFVTANGEIKETPTEQIASKQPIIDETQADIQPEYLDEEPGIFKTLTRLFTNPDLKAALENIQWITEYSNKNTSSYIKTYHVIRRPGAQLSNTLPQMRFGGRWMEKLGFPVAKPFKVIGMKDLMLIAAV